MSSPQRIGNEQKINNIFGGKFSIVKASYQSIFNLHRLSICNTSIFHNAYRYVITMTEKELKKITKR